MDSLLALYEDTIFEGTRTFELYEHTLVVRGRLCWDGKHQSNFQIRIALRDISPTYSEIRIRNSKFWAGLCLATFSLFVCLVMIMVFKMPILGRRVGLFAGIAFSGVLL